MATINIYSTSGVDLDAFFPNVTQTFTLVALGPDFQVGQDGTGRQIVVEFQGESGTFEGGIVTRIVWLVPALPGQFNISLTPAQNGALLVDFDGVAELEYYDPYPFGQIVGQGFHENNSGYAPFFLRGNDSMYGSDGNDRGRGYDGNDLIVGGAGNDTGDGGTGNDTLDGGPGNDLFIGGSGHDSYYTNEANEPVTRIVELPGGGIDTVFATVGFTGMLAPNVENIVLLDAPLAIVATGNNLNNRILGNIFPNKLFGGIGNDTLQGRGADDTLYGGLGGDEYVIDEGDDLIIEAGGSANDFAVQQIANLDLSQRGRQIDRIRMDPGAEEILANQQANLIVGNSADNTIDGGAGNDTLTGGPGGDVYHIDSAGDRVVEQVNDGGRDRVEVGFSMTLVPNVEDLTLTGTASIDGTGNAGGNAIAGNSGSNRLSGAGGGDTLQGGGGNDTLEGGPGNDSLEGGADTDTLSFASETIALTVSLAAGTATGASSDSLAGFENVTGGKGNDTLAGDDAANVLDGGSGADSLSGGSGNDIYVVDNLLDRVVETFGAGEIDAVRSSIAFSLASAQITGEVENLVLLGAALAGSGNALDNAITGNPASNSLLGGAGNDSLYGEAGNDTLDGETGDDLMTGGAGNDLYVLDSLDDEIVEIGGGGTDTVRTPLTAISLSAHIENLQYTSAAGVDALGNSANNLLSFTLTGGAGDDTLDGGAGDDTLAGGAGNDTYRVDTQADVIVDSAGSADRVIANVSYSIATNAAIEIAQAAPGTAAINLTGNALANTLSGNGGANVLDGGVGNDSMSGGSGADTYVVDSAGDRVTEDAGADIDSVRSTLSFDLAGGAVLGGTVENLLLLGTAANGAGNAADNRIEGNSAGNSLSAGQGNDTLLGNGGNDTLNGGSGDDLMDGGAGNDVYVVDGAGDAIVENALAAGGIDAVITELAAYTLAAALENLTLTVAAGAAGAGNSAANVILGGAGSDSLAGGAGNDTLAGGAANDTLDGGAGADSLVGGAGDDRYVLDNALDKSNEVGGAGQGDHDTVVVGFAFSLASLAFIEHVDLSGGASVGASGNASNNALTGNSGANLLAGAAGNDTLAGGAGNDTLEGGAGDDSLAGGEDTDTVTYVNETAAVTVNLATASAFGAGTDSLAEIENATGGKGNDAITGDASGNVLDGSLGADTLSGGGGTDTFVVDNAGDRVNDDASGDGDTVRSSLNFDLGSAAVTGGVIENLVLLGTASSGVGNSSDNRLEGNAGNNTLSGGTGNDTLIGNLGNDRLDGQGGIDTADYSGTLGAISVTLAAGTVSGGAGTDVLVAIEHVIGGAGNDLLTSGSESGEEYTLDGGAGDDTLVGGAGADYLDGGDGGGDWAAFTAAGPVVATLDAPGSSSSQGNDTITGVENLRGGAGADSLTGDGNDNVLDGGLGADTLTGGGGADTAYYLGRPATQAVVVNLSVSGDVTVGGALEDTLLEIENIAGGSGNDTLTGDGGGNVLDGGPGNDSLAGGDGNDTYVVDSLGDRVVEGGSGIDVIRSSVTIDLRTAATGILVVADTTSRSNIENVMLAGGLASQVFGNDSANALAGNSASNTLVGGIGDDSLDGGAGADSMAGGAGNDSYRVDNAGDRTDEVAPGSGGTDIVLSSVTFTLSTGVENLELTGGANANGTGNALPNEISGNNGNNLLVGLEANDTIDARAGHDTLDGGAGNDSLVGGDGNDVYIVGSTGDLVDESGTGTDRIESSVTLDLSIDGSDWAMVEHITLTGTGNIGVTGNDLANLLRGNTGHNALSGGGGSDSMEGGPGNDSYRLDAQTDVVSEIPNGGIDTVVVEDFGWTLGPNFENLVIEGVSGAAGTGNELPNSLIGNDGDNTLAGLAGNDTLEGGAGNDTLVGGAGNDTYVIETTSDVVLEDVNPGSVSDTLASWLIDLDLAGYANLEHLLLLGSDNLAAAGNSAPNLVQGNDGDNTLAGGAGNDTLRGGAGDDRLDGGPGVDSMAGGAGNDVYVIDSAGDRADESNGSGTDGIETPFTTVLGAAIENLTLTGSANVNGTGNLAGNVLGGNAASNRLTGLAGNDTLDGGSGNDTLDGGPGSDFMDGADGNDVYLVDSADDVVNESGIGDSDTVQSTVSFDLASVTRNPGGEIEVLLLAGTAAIHATGDGTANTIAGNSGANSLSGGDGNDTLDGGAGIDTLLGGADDDVFVYDTLDARIDGGEGSDTLRVSGAGRTIDLIAGTTPAQIAAANAGQDDRFESLEVIDLTGTGSNTLKLNIEDVALVVDGTLQHSLRVDGNGGDVVQSTSTWTLVGLAQVGDLLYVQYTDPTGDITLLVNPDVTQIIQIE